jgi:4-amino-4-deoxychorismate lyase
MKTGQRVLVNGEPATGVAAWDRGLHYGDGIFRTLKVTAGRVRWWQDHYDKLASDCAALGLPCPEAAPLKAEVDRVASVPDAGVVKILVTRGGGDRGYRIPGQVEPTRLVMGFPAGASVTEPVTLRWCDLRLSHQPRLAGIKHLNRLENVLARSEWQDPGIAEGLLCDETGLVICGTMSNVFIVESGALVTPDLSRCGVAGVARQRVLRAASRHGTAVAVEDIAPERLLAADQVLLCNSLIGVWQAGTLGGRAWPDTGWASQLRYWLDETH